MPHAVRTACAMLTVAAAAACGSDPIPATDDTGLSPGVDASTPSLDGGPAADETAPSAPASLRVTGTTCGPDRVDLAWDASIDDVGVTGYRIYRLRDADGDGTFTFDRVGTSETTAFGEEIGTEDSRVPAGMFREHAYEVSAYDAAGNESERAAATGTTCGTVHEIPPDISSDCTVDVTAALQTWIDGVPDGVSESPSVLRFGESACYRLDGELVVRDRSWLSFEGRGSTLDQHFVEGEPGRGAWEARRGSNLSWRSFLVIGAHEAKHVPRWPSEEGLAELVSLYGHCSYASRSCEWQAGWTILGTHGFTLIGNTTRNTYGDSVQVMWDYPDDTTNATDGLIDWHRVEGAGRQGISVVGGENVTIQNSFIEGAAQTPIDLEPEDTRVPTRYPVEDIFIRNNTFGVRYVSVNLGTGACIPMRNIQFTGNSMEAYTLSSWPNVYARAPAGCTSYRGTFLIEDNTLAVGEWNNDHHRAISLTRISDVIIRNNRIGRMPCVNGTSCRPDEPPIQLTGGTGLEVRENDMHEWDWVYEKDGSVHGAGVDACGNATSAGTDQPSVCTP